MASDVVNERAQLILKRLVERYIRDGLPVGSKSLLEEAGLPISPATVRNVMSDLEERGLITSPHTSAGRIPTAQGFRLFVDNLITMRPIDAGKLLNLETQLDPDKSANELAQTASRLLSSLTAQAGLVTVPRSELLSLRQIDFVPLTGNRVLVILVINDHDVQNRVLHTSRPFGEEELRRAGQMINQRFAGHSLSQIRRGLVAAMEDDRQSIDGYMQSVLDLASQAFEPEGVEPATDYMVAGEGRLVSASSPEEIGRLQSLFDAFEQKRDILELVDRSIDAEGIQIFIGEESGYEVLGGFSLITAPYRASGMTLGVLGVIGPTRMAYEKVIPMVDVTAQLLGSALDKT